MPDPVRARPIHPPASPLGDRPVLVFLGAGLVIAVETATQYVAWRYRFHPNLGNPLIVFTDHTVRLLRAMAVIATGSALCALLFPLLRPLAGPLLLTAVGAGIGTVGPIYPPYRLFLWYAANARVPAAAGIFRGGWALLVAVGVGSAFAATRLRRPRDEWVPSDAYGSAHWGAGATLHRETGLLLGRQPRRLLRAAGEGHLLTLAPTRSGKGVSAVIPNLLDHPGSVLVTDPKGENYAVTARWRREHGQTVHAFDPFGVVRSHQASYNPLDLIDVARPDAVDDARLLADMLVLSGGREGEQAFWDEEARGVLTGLLLHVAASAAPAQRTLMEVRALLTSPPNRFAALLREMSDSPAVDGLVARAAARILQKAEKERSSVLSTAHRHTHFLDSPQMAHVLQQSTVDWSALLQGTTSAYLILPTYRMAGYARWLRVMIACALIPVTRAQKQPPHRVLFLLDEFAHLGPMLPVQHAIGLAGGFGVSFWLIVQDLSQLKSLYGEAWPTFLANVDGLQAFGIRDWDTAEYLSKMTGEATIVVDSENESRGESTGRHAQGQVGTSRTRSERARRLLLPDEILRLPREAELLFVKDEAPLLVQRLSYLRDREFKGRHDPNPLYDRVAPDGH